MISQRTDVFAEIAASATTSGEVEIPEEWTLVAIRTSIPFSQRCDIL